MDETEFNVCCYGIIILMLIAIGLVAYEEATAVYVNSTQELVDKQIIHNNRYPSGKDVYRLYTNQSYDVSLKDYNSVEIGDNLTIGFSDNTYHYKLYLNNHTYDANV